MFSSGYYIDDVTALCIHGSLWKENIDEIWKNDKGIDYKWRCQVMEADNNKEIHFQAKHKLMKKQKINTQTETLSPLQN